MAKVLVAFGDSWPHGAELDSLTSPDRYIDLDWKSHDKLARSLKNIPTPVSAEEHYRRGEYLKNTFRYPTLVGDALAVDKVINLTGYGTSLNHLFLYLSEFKKIYDRQPLDQYIFLVSLTAEDRDMYFDPVSGDPKEIMPYDGGLGKYYKFFHHRNIGKVSWAKNVMMLQMFCKLHNIPDFYFQAFRPFYHENKYHDMIDWSRIYKNAEKSFMNVFAERENVAESYPTNGEFYQPEIKKYFWPCQHHPNILGHETIAEEIICFIKSLNPELIPA